MLKKTLLACKCSFDLVSRSVHSSGWHRRAVLWWVARVLRWLCICANDLLCEILYFLVLNFPPTDSN